MAVQDKTNSEKEHKRAEKEIKRLTSQVTRYSAMSQHPSCSPMDKARYRLKLRDARAALRLALRARRMM